jgi:hypothetical protein
MNRQIALLVTDWVATSAPGASTGLLVQALENRENQALDLIRMRAAEQGLFAAVVAAVLLETGLGTEPSPGERAMIQTEAAQQQAEIARMAEEFRRRFGGG